MTDPNRPQDYPWQPGEPAQNPYQQYPDPAYGPNPTARLPQQGWGSGQYPPNEPPGSAGGGEPPAPHKSRRWLWIVAGLAVVAVVGSVIALVLADGSTEKSTTVASPSVTKASGAPTATKTRPPSSKTTTTKTSPGTSSETSSPDATETVVYSVTGEGQALNISYMGAGGALQTEFNVTLPWTKEVMLTSEQADAAVLTVANFGSEVGCTVTVNGTQVSKNNGSLVTVCAAAG